MPTIWSTKLVKHLPALLSILIVALACNASAQNEATGNTASDGNKTEIEADRLETNSEERYAEFIGNVKARQGGYRLTADKLRIYYLGDAASLGMSSSEPGAETKIERIVALGNVRIESEDYTVDTSRAEYDVASQVMTLTGANSRVTQGKNTLIGSKITLYQADGRVKVDGESGKRVKVIFFPEGKEADFFKAPGQEGPK